MKHFMLLLAASLIALCPAHASDWSFYGSARIQTFMEKLDHGDFPQPGETSYSQYLQTNSRIGARVKVSDEISGRFEYGSDANIRLLYGKWDFGKGSLLVGQAYSPLNINYSNQVWWDDTNLTDMGGVYSSRNPMIRLKFGQFQIAALKPDTPAVSNISDSEVGLPKIEIKYRISKDGWDIQIAGGHNAYTLKSGSKEYDIRSYVLALGGSLKTGPLFLGATVRAGQNTGSYALENLAFDTPAINLLTDTVIDNRSYGYTLVAGYTFNEHLYVEAGYGYSKADLDHSSYSKDKMFSYYLQTRLTLAPGVYVVPEVGMVDWGKTTAGLGMGQTKYLGAKWQIDF